LQHFLKVQTISQNYCGGFLAVLIFIYYLQPENFSKQMKLRLSTVLVILFLSITVFSSCTKEYKCRCVISYSGEPGLPDTVIKVYPVTDKKEQAQAVCEENSDSTVTGRITTVEKCKLY